VLSHLFLFSWFLLCHFTLASRRLPNPGIMLAQEPTSGLEPGSVLTSIDVFCSRSPEMPGAQMTKTTDIFYFTRWRLTPRLVLPQRKGNSPSCVLFSPLLDLPARLSLKRFRAQLLNFRLSLLPQHWYGPEALKSRFFLFPP